MSICASSQYAFAAQTAEQTLADDEAAYEPTPIVKKKKSKKNSKDFYEVHKSAPKKSLSKAGAVQADDLMKAMRQDLEPAPMLVEPPVAQAAPVAPKPVVKGPASSQIIAPIPSSKLSPTQDVNADSEFPPVTSKAVPAVVPVQTKSEAAPVVKKEEAKVEPAKAAEKPADKNTAPLLSDLADAPDGIVESKAPSPSDKQADKPEIEPKVEAKVQPQAQPEMPSAEAPKAAPSAPDGFSKPRPLFSAPGDTRAKPGVSRVSAPAAEMKTLPKVANLYDNAPTAALPPAPAPTPAAEPMIKPVEAAPTPEKKSIWQAPNPELTKGKVLFSQTADGQVENAPDSALVPETANVVSTQTADAPENTDAPAQAAIAPEPLVEQAPASVAAAPVPEQRVTTSTYNPASGSSVHGSCGAVNGVGLATKPTSNLCTQGTASAVSGVGPWSWECKGSNGGSNAKCSATLQVNGECGMANGSQSASPPPGKLCTSGKATTITGNGPWYWSCFGDNGGVTAQCVAYTLVSGACGTANNIAVATPPVLGLCASGHETAVIGDGPWSWSCTGSGEGTTVNCTAPILRQGECGSANNFGSATQPVVGLCASGNASAISGSGPWNWNCAGENGGGSVSCSAPILLNASCGPSHGVGVASAPSQGLCVSGNASAVSGTGPWNWSCLGENGGAMVNCMAPKKVDGLCGPSHQNGTADAPQSGLCSAGTPSAVGGTGPWQWTCQGAGGGITSNCISQPLVHAGCGAAHGVSVMAAPTDNLCVSGNATTVIGSGPFMWSCQGANGGSAVNCMAPLQVNGACGAADGVPVNAMPTGNLCRTGQASNVTGNGPYIWTCQGAGGGISTTCQAPLQNAEPVPPTATAPVAPSPEVHVPEATAKAGNECTPSVKRWTITCQQGGYPSNFTGVIVGETQTLCPMNVERGVWLSNSCAAATNSAPISPSPGKLETPAAPYPKSTSVTDVLPEIAPKIAPMAANDLAPPRKLFTPQYKHGAVVQQGSAPQAAPEGTSLAFSGTSEGLDGSAINTLDGLVNELRGDEKSIVTLNAYASTPASGDQQESRRIALARALSVRSYLMRKGFASNRIDVRAVGPASDNRGDDRVDIKVK